MIHHNDVECKRNEIIKLQKGVKKKLSTLKGNTKYIKLKIRD